MTFTLLANVAASIDELKRNPMRIIREGAGETVLIIHRNKPAFYAVPPALYEAMFDAIDDANLAEVMHSRRDEPTVQLDIDDLTDQEQ